MKKVDVKESLQKSKSFFDEFKIFIKRGNVLDLAVGVIVGGAFGTIVSSLVDDILMPIVGIIIGGHDFSNLSIKVGSAVIRYGAFIQNVIDFLIVAFCVFIFVKLINRFFVKEKIVEEKEENKKSEEVILLEEIRDLLKKNNKKKK